MVRCSTRRTLFPRALGCSPECTAGQTACPEEFLARARKVCGELKGAGLALIRKRTSDDCTEEGKMRSGTCLSSNSENLIRKELGGRTAKKERILGDDDVKDCNQQAVQRREIGFEESGGDLPACVRASVAVKRGEYDARRLRSQREIIRDVMLAATDCDTWLTLGELRALTHYGEASISAQLRHLRKLENGGYDVSKQRREGAVATAAVADMRGECVWEYRIVRALQTGHDAPTLVRQEVPATS